MNRIEQYLESCPDNTEIINISERKLFVMPDLSRFTNLRILYCYGTNISNIDYLSPTLEQLWCNNNRIRFIPPLPTNLRILNCEYNQLSYLPKLNHNLQILYCSNNNIKVLPELNENLSELYCANNQLTQLPDLKNLSQLYCGYNNLLIYPKHNLHEVKIINKFRFRYFMDKYGKRIFYYLLRKRMNKNNFKNILLEKR